MPETKKRSGRSNPIAETLQTVSGYPAALKVYRIAGSRFYHARFYFNGRYYGGSTKTENLKQAREFAVKLYQDVVLGRLDTEKSNKKDSFAVIGSEFLDIEKKTAKPSLYRNDYSKFKNDMIPFFKGKNIKDIKYKDLVDYVDHISKRGISQATIKHHLVVLNKIFNYAVRNDYLDSAPLMPKLTGKVSTELKRDWFSNDEYKKLIKVTEMLADQKESVRGVTITLEMKFLIQFMVNSFLRPSDLRVLKHKHIERKLDIKTGSSWLALSHPATKTTATEVQSMPACVHVYDKLIEFKKTQKISCSAEDYVFFPEYLNRDTFIGVVGRLFKRIVEVASFKNADERMLTLYSLRHTCIMLRLINGDKIDLLSLARNSRTSVAMIDKYYARHLTSADVVHVLHSFRE